VQSLDYDQAADLFSIGNYFERRERGGAHLGSARRKRIVDQHDFAAIHC
jgi:hypothetical protein